MSVTVTRRAATEGEAAQLPKLRTVLQPLVVGWFVVTVFVGIFAVVLQVVLSLGRKAIAIPWWAIDTLPWVLAGAAAVFLTVETIRTALQLRRRAETPATSNEVDELVVRDAKVVTLDTTEPTWCFELEAGRLLVLSGDRLGEPDTYGAPKPLKPFKGAANGLDAPHSFPSAAFTLVRDPHAGEVLWIRVEGPYLAPTASELRPGKTLRNSELLNGSLAQLEAALAAA